MSDVDPYQPPSASIAPPINDNPNSGTLEGGIAGDYSFRIGELIHEGWERSSGMRASLWWGATQVSLIYLLIYVAGIVLLTALAKTSDAGFVMLVVQLLLQSALVAISMPLFAGVVMMGVQRSVGRPIRAKMAFAYMGAAMPLYIAGFMVQLLTQLGMFLLVLPGIYLAVAYSMVSPLITDKGLSFGSAMEASRRAVTTHWFQIFLFYLALALILIVSLIPLGIGMIWSYPMAVNAYGTLYRIIFGVSSSELE